MTMDSARGGSASSPETEAAPRTLEVASWLLYASAAMIGLVAFWTFFSLPGPLQAVPDDAVGGGRYFYVVTLLIPVAALHFFSGRWAVAGKLRGFILGTLLALLMVPGSYQRSVLGPLPEDGEPLSVTTQTMGTVYLVMGLSIIVLLWVPPSFRYLRLVRKQRRDALD